MQISKEKLTYLLFLYKQKDMNYTATRMAKEVGVSKSTFSRVLNNFYQEGLINEKGKGVLSCQGCKLARSYLNDINKLRDWLKNTSSFNDEEAYQEALNLVLTLSPESRAKLVSNSSKEKLFKLIDKVKEISGDMLSANLDDGEYPFAFTIYKADKLGISMANDGFVHPGILEIKMGHGNLISQPKEVEHESLMGKMILKGKVESLKYETEQKYIASQVIMDNFVIPISKLYFYYSKEERILQTSVKIKVKSNVGMIHMPESVAILTIILK
ncbi:helix-turn-helix domain-containing protein [Thomasclavelia saccharogumia]|uniref:helix-turn-helix domain-containing protein n=1 Tax=Thomasclavelia saccharogumia TaxID=341225 RepID=UPI00047A31AE|nr:helix-turn-helix domain-containing protein [Thomasclavelia saccharogumia]